MSLTCAAEFKSTHCWVKRCASLREVPYFEWNVSIINRQSCCMPLLLNCTICCAAVQPKLQS